MYCYDWDIESGGIILNTKPQLTSKEPRPVYSDELDILGFNEFFDYEKDDKNPYLWAEYNSYYYRGIKIAQTSGGNIYQKPILTLYNYSENSDNKLVPIDIQLMISKNKEIIDILKFSAIIWIYNIYLDYKKKVDSFHVAFSGGKDSVVLFDLVSKALPKDAYIVVFGDTQMEFPDTYDVVNAIESNCKSNGIVFLRAKSRMGIYESWEKFGPPSTAQRWCCSVHKTAPQLIALKNYYNNKNLRDMAFVGIRGCESIKRSQYESISYGLKHNKQHSCYPILDWNSAELYLYMFANDLIINKCYKKGNNRAGCLICPMSTERSEYMRYKSYTYDVSKFINIINSAYDLEKREADSNIANGGWKQRRSGKLLNNCKVNYIEQLIDDTFTIIIDFPSSNWKEWIKTIGKLNKLSTNEYFIFSEKSELVFTVNDTENGYKVSLDNKQTKSNQTYFKYFKQVFKKAASCIGCNECTANCPLGCINFDNDYIKITRCKQCLACHKISNGCLLYSATKTQIGGANGMRSTASIDRYASHGPQEWWFRDFFDKGDDFILNNNLGTKMLIYFKAFLRDSELLKNNKCTPLFNLIKKLGCLSEQSLGILLVNLSYTPQVNCFIKNVAINQSFNREQFVNFICRFGISETSASKLVYSYERLINLFTDVGLGCVKRNENRIESITRNRWLTPDNLVLLYAIYKFACANNTYNYSLRQILTSSSYDGLSPSEIFGLTETEIITALRALTALYPNYIRYSETHGLNSITLNKDITPDLILSLFYEET
ncbi:MAG: DUF4007 family protein [Christensenellaceae bacterium]|jgi:phosphoadenosine phosphosulfate reductase|nr:DUF4007 family protein [Christensenellaceae bacterium]